MVSDRVNFIGRRYLEFEFGRNLISVGTFLLAFLIYFNIGFTPDNFLLILFIIPALTFSVWLMGYLSYKVGFFSAVVKARAERNPIFKSIYDKTK
jgi:hypothetical protein